MNLNWLWLIPAVAVAALAMVLLYALIKAIAPKLSWSAFLIVCGVCLVAFGASDMAADIGGYSALVRDRALITVGAGLAAAGTLLRRVRE